MKCLLAVLLLAAALNAQASPWSVLGGGIAGQAGVPALSGLGALTPGSPGALRVSGTPAFAPALLFFSFVQVAVPFKGGQLEAFPPIGQFTLSTGPSGLLLPWGAWPAVLPPDLDIYFQIAVLDAAAVQDVALTNLLLGTTQP